MEWRPLNGLHQLSNMPQQPGPFKSPAIPLPPLNWGESAPAAHSQMPRTFQHQQQVQTPVRSLSSNNHVSAAATVDKINYPIHTIPAKLYDELSPEYLATLPKPNSIAKRKYSTAIDERNFLTVYEFQINGNWIIWDYYTGLVHLTGLWKAIGNHKADIVKLIDSSPELATVVKRVRGGFLKIQGTWVPFEVARTLASKFCFDIRYSLITVFGESFIHECLKPSDKGFGFLRLYFDEDEYNGVGVGKDGKRRRRRRTNPTAKRELAAKKMSAVSVLPPQQKKSKPHHRSTKSLPVNKIQNMMTSPLQTSANSGFSSSPANQQKVSRGSSWENAVVSDDDDDESKYGLASVSRKSSDPTRPKMFNSDREGIIAVLQAARLQDQKDGSHTIDYSTLEAANSLMGVRAPTLPPIQAPALPQQQYRPLQPRPPLPPTLQTSDYKLYTNPIVKQELVGNSVATTIQPPLIRPRPRGKMDIHGLLS